MPPRHTYWTILVNDGPTAFRAHDRADLVPTATQLRATQDRVELKWFGYGRLWNSPDEARLARQRPPAGATAPSARAARDKTWRPGGANRDPREAFRDRAREKWRRVRAERHTRRNPKKASS